MWESNSKAGEGQCGVRLGLETLMQQLKVTNNHMPAEFTPEGWHCAKQWAECKDATSQQVDRNTLC